MVHPDCQELAVESPIRLYRRADNGREVRLVGMVHFGRTDYYDAVTRAIAEREHAGDAVHYEGVTPASDEQLRAAPLLVRVKANLLRAIDHTAERYMHQLHGVGQADKFVIPPTWENHDATELQIAARLGLGALIANMPENLATRFFLDRLSPDLLQNIFQEAANARLQDSRTDTQANQTVIYGKGLDRVIIDYRNQVALEAQDQHAEDHPGQNLVMVWGLGHLARLGAGMVDRGYDMVSEATIAEP